MGNVLMFRDRGVKRATELIARVRRTTNVTCLIDMYKSGPTAPSLPKCPHDVYAGKSARPGDRADYCTGCTPTYLVPETLTSLHPLPERKTCPACGSLRFRFKSEWEWTCFACGAEALCVIETSAASREPRPA